MTIQNCSICGGMHFGSNECPFIESPCVVCGDMTIMACSDCAIESGGKQSVHVCKKTECRHEHEFWRHKAGIRNQSELDEADHLHGGNPSDDPEGRADKCLCPDFELRGQVYEIWPDSQNSSNRCLVDPRKNEVVDTDNAFDPPLSNDELLR